jgi:hypothetical protein
MGLCYGKSAAVQEPAVAEENNKADGAAAGRGDGPPASPAKVSRTPKQLKLSFYLPSPLPPSSYKGSPANSSVASTPARDGFKRPFLSPSPAKHIRALLARRHGSVKSISEGGEPDLGLDKSFGYSRHFAAKYDLGREVGRGHFGFTCAAKCKKGELKGEDVAVKVIPKAKVRAYPPLIPPCQFLLFGSSLSHLCSSCFHGFLHSLNRAARVMLSCAALS